MSAFKAKMHQMRFRPPGPTGGAYSALSDPLAGFNGATSKVKEGRGRKGSGKRKGEGGRKGKGEEGKGWEGKFRGQWGKGRERGREKGRGGRI